MGLFYAEMTERESAKGGSAALVGGIPPNPSLVDLSARTRVAVVRIR
jgi:hypothetical protein